MKAKNPVVSERRRFLKGLLGTGGAAALAAMTPQATSGKSATAASRTPERRSAGGYRRTAHVRDYYRSLRI